VSELFDGLREGYERDLAGLDDELQRTLAMLNEIDVLLCKIVAVYSDNPTIVRSLYANHAFFLKLYPGEGVERVFRHMFPQTGALEAYFLLGFDFLRSGHLDLADRVFRRAARYIATKKAEKNGASPDALYRTRRMLFIGGNPKTSPEAARRLELVRAYEEQHKLKDMFLR
jgi:hypothetical protein